MQISDFLPPLSILLSYFLFSQLRFENQRWGRIIRGGRSGSSALATGFVLLSEILALVFAFGVILFLFWFASWKVALGLFLVKTLLGAFWAFTVGKTYSEQFLIHAISTVALWPTAIFIALKLHETYL